jgi:hypothetical protein
MKAFVYVSGSDFYYKIALVCCLSHKNLNQDLQVHLLTSDNEIPKFVKNVLNNEGITYSIHNNIQTELSYCTEDKDFKRFYTFARWACYIDYCLQIESSDISHILLDPDIVSVNAWCYNFDYIINPFCIALTRQFGWDNFINGGFVAGTPNNLLKIGNWLLNLLKEDCSKRAYVKSPYDQTYWNREFAELGLLEITLPKSFIQNSVEKNVLADSFLVHQIDYKGFLGFYPFADFLTKKYNITFTNQELNNF